MSTQALVITLALTGLAIGALAIYLAIWSKIGLGEKIEKGFADLRTAGSLIGKDLDKRMADLVEIIKLQVTQKGTATYELKNIGKADVSILDRGENKTEYRIRVTKQIFKQDYLIVTANASKEFIRKEKVLFGEKETVLRSPIANILHVGIPSVDKTKCAEFMAFLLNWLDTVYFGSLEDLKEEESTIGKYMGKE